jgi:hypothetical protein
MSPRFSIAMLALQLCRWYDIFDFAMKNSVLSAHVPVDLLSLLGAEDRFVVTFSSTVARSN